MAIVLAFVFLAAAVVAFVAYGGTPHGGPTTTCGPIQFFGHTYTINGDCRYVSAVEVTAAIAFLLIALITVMAARPRR
jgi:hypothetical protein